MVKFGVIGFGLAAKVFHLPILTRLADVQVTSVYSSKDPSQIQQVLPEVTVFSCLDEFFKEADMDVVLVLTPNEVHANIAQLALEHDKHVIIDKPFVCHSKEGEGLIEIAKRQNKLLSVYHNRRWDGDFLTLSRLVAENKLGEVTYFESRFDKYRPRVWGRWREQDVPGAGLLYDMGSHLIDQALTLFGLPQDITAKVLQQRENAQAPDYFDIQLSYGDDALLVRLRGSSLARVTPFRFYVEGTQGTFVKQSQDVQETQMAENMSPYDDEFGMDDEEHYGNWFRMPPDGNIQNKEHDEPIPVATERGSYQRFYENFLRAVSVGEPLEVQAEQALNVIKVIELAHQSSISGKEVPFE